MTRAAALALVLTLAACGGPIPDVGKEPDPKPVERPKFEPVPVPIVPGWWRWL